MKNLIPNHKIKLDDLPEIGDESAIAEFAGTFDGYDFHGSLAKCSRAAQLSNRETLTELRNELFFAWRAARHSVGDEYIAKYEELLPHFKKILATTHG